MTDIYMPREDSELLASFVRQHAFGKTVDVGCGSGIQALEAADNPKVTSVLALDKNLAAVAHVQEELRKRGAAATTREAAAAAKITVMQSDLFSAVGDRRFDTIICNPPYLPDEKDEKDDSGAGTGADKGGADKDIALYGGKDGHEWSVRFLKQAKEHLSPDGHILFLLSSLTNKERIDRTLRELEYAHEELGMLAVGFFERLYVYRIWRKE